LALNFWLRGPLGAGGIALSTSVSAILDTALLFYLFSRRWGPLWESSLARSLLSTSGASVVLGLVAAAFTRFPWMEPGHSIGLRCLALSAAILLAGGAFLAAARLMGSGEVAEVLALVSRRGRSARRSS